MRIATQGETVSDLGEAVRRGQEWVDKNIFLDIESPQAMSRRALAKIGWMSEHGDVDVYERGDMSSFPPQTRAIVSAAVNVRREILSDLLDERGIECSESLLDLAESARVITVDDLTYFFQLGFDAQCDVSDQVPVTSYAKVADALASPGTCAVFVGKSVMAAMMTCCLGYLDLVPAGVENILVVDPDTARKERIVEAAIARGCLFTGDPANWQTWRETFPEAMLLYYWSSGKDDPDRSCAEDVAASVRLVEPEDADGRATLSIRPFANMPYSMRMFQEEHDAIEALLDGGMDEAGLMEKLSPAVRFRNEHCDFAYAKDSDPVKIAKHAPGNEESKSAFEAMRGSADVTAKLLPVEPAPAAKAQPAQRSQYAHLGWMY